VLSGVTSRELAQSSPIKPDYIFADIRELAQKLVEVNCPA